MKLIKLTRGLVTKIDDEDYEYLNKHTWHANWQRRAFYAANSEHKLMHRIIVKPDKGLVVDHINHDTLDNQRNNLRCVTPSENSRNRKSGRGGISYRGNSFEKPWRLRIYFGVYERKHIGVFSTYEEAKEMLDAYTDR